MPSITLNLNVENAPNPARKHFEKTNTGLVISFFDPTLICPISPLQIWAYIVKKRQELLRNLWCIVCCGRLRFTISLCIKEPVIFHLYSMVQCLLLHVTVAFWGDSNGYMTSSPTCSYLIGRAVANIKWCQSCKYLSTRPILWVQSKCLQH